MNNSYPATGKSLWLGVILAGVSLFFWELYWRSQGYPIAPEDGKGLWAQQRARLDNLDSTGVVLIGSSRVLFNIQLDEWEEVTGTRPIMLAAAGSTPLPVFKDIVENTGFNGTLIVGVTPPLFFSPLAPDNQSFTRIQSWVEHYYDRTYAERLNHFLSRFPQDNLAFLNSSEEAHTNELDLRKLIGRFATPDRVPGPPPFPMFSYLDHERNITMLTIMTEDTSYASLITDFWSFIFESPRDMPPPEAIESLKNELIDLNIELVNKLKDRGGQVIYLRNPSQDRFREVERGGFSREVYWDKLLEGTGAPGYHFEDYEFMNRYRLPEWSHLATPDAKQFTRDLARQMLGDGVLRLPNNKNKP